MGVRSLNFGRRDGPVKRVDFVDAPKRGRIRRSDQRNAPHFRPAVNIRIEGEAIGTGERFTLAGSKRGHRIELDLFDRQGQPLRQWHNHGPHPNPDGSRTEKTHKHLPSIQYPLEARHDAAGTWAYSTQDVSDISLWTAARAFCEECKIDIVGGQLPLEAIEE